MLARSHGDVLRPAGYRSSSLNLAGSTIAISTLSLALPIMTVQIYDRVLPNHSAGTLVVLATGVLVIVLLEVMLRLARSYVIGFAGASYVHRLSCDAMRHVLAADLAKVAGAKARIDIGGFGAIRNLKDFYSGHALTTLIELIFVPLFLGLIAYIGGYLVFAPLSVLVLFAGYSFANGQQLMHRLDEREASDDQRYKFLIGVLAAVHSVKAFAQEQSLLRRYERLQRDSCVANLGVSQVVTSSFNASALFAYIMTAVTVGFGALAAIDGALSVGALIATVLLSGRIMQPVQRALMLWARYQDFRISKKKVEELFQAPVVVDATEAALPAKGGALEVKELSFAYSADESLLLDGISLSLEIGQVVSITGAAASGKTTLLKLIAGLHRPSSGVIRVNGLEPTSYPPHRLNDHVGYMATDGVIFRGTIKDNITRFGDAPIAQAMYAAQLLGLDEEFAKLPAGLDTKLEGTGADSLPPGIKQRIALVRVLASKPRILLFDNADRGLDMAGYEKLHTLLWRLRTKVSMIIVSDDENLRGLAGRHCELDSGKLYDISSVDEETTRRRSYRNVRL